ncbi:nuclear pore complex protein Nup214-like isoform X2 [Pectinophora gossypiella]|uniref:nuclear pore complex protein Nup214-like isoform X2 n=1 Tax=Pectinophora gossypiella TaxID=13191 RepID=UPI00214F08DC|nr:nuclear pore complex protein Nup214-like isoform X2 [Pectinophora gossypiella]
MEVQFGPNSVDEPNLLYKLQRKIKVFNTNNALSNRGYNLVGSSSKYGIVFVGAPDGTLSVYQLKELIDKDCDPKHFPVKLLEKPTHIAVSCDQELLATTGGQLLCIYKVADFQNVNVSPSVTIKLDVNPSTFVSALQWNPCIPDNIAIAFFDGTLLVSTVTSSQVKKVQAKARCICWSPKGKQLVTGNSDGSLCQFKPDLTLAKTVPAPNLFEGAPVEALAIYWISTFQFAVVFRDASSASRPSVTIVNTPKAGQPSCLNFEDICYSMGSNRPWYYYLQGIPQWNLIFASSSNSMEIATLGSADGANWVQWCQSDEARPELPLTDKKQENYPVGVCIDICGIHQLPWGENETLPHMPLLHVVSQTGLLTIFNVINLKKDAVQVCLPPQQQQPIALPGAALTGAIPDDVPAQITIPAPAPVVAAPKPQIQPAPQAAPTPQPAPSAFNASGQFPSMTPSQAKPFGLPSQPAPSIAAPTPQLPPKPEVKPVAPAVQTQPPPLPQKTQAVLTPKPQPSQASEINAALKAEQEKMNKMKADQELKSMLVKEVNDFQMELYKFVCKTREVQNKLQQDLNSIDANFNFQSLNTEALKKECSLDELRGAIVQLKLELVRACAVVAEARTHAEAKDLHQWTQADPLTTKRVASVKNLAYYVQTQLEQAHKALDYKWNEMAARDPQFNKPGQRMIRPILDDVYQPLVRQQEILSRQQAVLRTLRNTLKECDTAPMFKSTSLLRNTPFRNKDPLSKLTKNILNMSVEPQNNKTKDSLLTPHKLDALRDILSNHKPTKIKPVSVELRQHLAQMRISYEKSVKDKPSPEVYTQQIPVKMEPAQQRNEATKASLFEGAKPIQSTNVPIKQEMPKPAPQMNMPINIPSFTPVSNVKPSMPGVQNVARTLFTEDSNKTHSPPQTAQQQPIKPQTFGFAPPTSTNITASVHTRSILKDMLQNKQANIEAKNDANTFMGQKICSPSAFAFSTVQSATPQAPTASFTSKPISDINNMFSKFTPQAFSSESKPQVAIKTQSEETGETVPTEVPKVAETKKQEDKPQPSMFQMKTSTPLTSSTQNVPDIIKANTQTTTKSEKPIPKAEKLPEKSKENLPEKAIENVTPTVPKNGESEKNENVLKSLNLGNKPSTPLFGSSTGLTSPTQTRASPAPSETPKAVEVKPVSQPENLKIEKSETPPASSAASSLFAAANAASPTAAKPQQLFGSSTSTSSAASIFAKAASTPPTTPTDSPASKEPSSPATTTSVSAASLFGTAAASQAFAKPSQSGSIFSSTSTPSSVFGSTQGSIFGTTSTTTQSTSVFGTSTAQSAFSSSESKPSVFSTPSPSSPSSVFGSAATTAQSVFGSSSASVFAATTTKSSSVFGSPSVFGTTTTTAPVFGTTTGQTVFGTATTTTAQSVFGVTTTTTQSMFGSASSPSIFGSAAAVSTPSSVFGSSASTPQSVFGTAQAATTQASGSIFGGTATTQSSIFGSSSPTTQASVFGATSQASVFGSPTAVTQASVFGTATATTQASVFGSPTQTTQASVFGSQPTTTAGGSLFGGTDNLFAAASISTTSAASPTTGGSIFGGGSSGSVFGGGSPNVFGGKTSFSQSNPQAASIFGGGTAFGQKPSTNFWAGGNANSGNTFGSSGFGQQTTTQASSIFGGTTGGSFSSPSGGQPFGSPQQSSVFGSPQQQQPSSAFGGSPVFGSKPAFGQPAAGFGGFNKSPSSGFGGAASFGGAPAFGAPAFGGTSPSKVFGGTAPAPNFAATQSNATFESLATQNTLTFGNLAQQSTTPSPPAPSFNASPSFTGWRG